jgi:NADPH:quinone reductase-like Zn-dependent oxidoreductase
MLEGGLKEPAIPGSDGSGVVEAVGSGVTTLRPGDEVIINPSLHWGEREDAYDPATWSILGVPVNGTFAEYIAVPASHVHPRPAHLSFEEAAALPLAGLTAYRALFPQGEMQPGDHILIHGIGGGVALFALQFAKACGARVMVTSTQDWKLTRAAELGADAGVNSKTADWVQQAREWTGGRGVDLVIDSLGGSTSPAASKRCAWAGGWSTTGARSAPSRDQRAAAVLKPAQDDRHDDGQPCRLRRDAGLRPRACHPSRPRPDLSPGRNRHGAGPPPERGPVRQDRRHRMRAVSAPVVQQVAEPVGPIL